MSIFNGLIFGNSDILLFRDCGIDAIEQNGLGIKVAEIAQTSERCPVNPAFYAHPAKENLHGPVNRCVAHLALKFPKREVQQHDSR
jgi:hypothetical protein